MSRPRFRRILLGFFALAVGALPACMTMARVSPELEARRSRIARAAVLPPETKFVLVTFKGDNPRMSAEEENAKAVVPGMIAAKLREHGLVVVDNEVASRSDLRFEATELQATFDQALGDLFAAQGPTRQAVQVSRSLGPQAARVADPVGVDALALVRIEGYSKSGGEIAKDLAKSFAVGMMTGGLVVPVYQTSGARIAVALIDGTNGDVLWTNVAYMGPGSFDSPRLQALVDAAFNSFPPGSFGIASISASTSLGEH
jgi:hypothetical protein